MHQIRYCSLEVNANTLTVLQHTLLSLESGTILSDADDDPGKGQITDKNLETLFFHHIHFFVVYLLIL